MSGRFISFEGIDGAGKSSHIDALAQRWREAGQPVVCTREPGGTPLAEQLRELMLHASMEPLTEALVVFAARHEHIRQVIAPALAEGKTVLCDRFTDASFAYQGAGRGFDLGVLGTLEGWVQQGLQPELTVWFDLPAEVAEQRRASARAPDRFERLDVDFFQRVRAGYQARMNADPGRFLRLDAAQTREQVWADLVQGLEARGW